AIFAERVILAQRLLHPAQIRLAEQCPQQLTCTLDWQRHGEAVLEFEHEDFLHGTQDRSPFPGHDVSYPVRAVHDHVSDRESHPLRLAIATILPMESDSSRAALSRSSPGRASGSTSLPARRWDSLLDGAARHVADCEKRRARRSLVSQVEGSCDRGRGG